MYRYVAGRVLWMGIVILGVSALTFIVTFEVPANPAQMVAGPEASIDTVERIHHELGLDKPLVLQFGLYLRGLLNGNLGESWRMRRPVAGLVAERLPATFQLAAAGILMEVFFGFPIGIASALRQNSALDRGLMAGSFLFLAAPQFWLGLVLLYVFGFMLPVLPLGGYGTASHLVLPALTIGLAYSPWYARVLRSSLLDVLDTDFIRTSRAKGLAAPKVVLRHALPNAFRPVLTLMGNDLAQYLGGVIVIEQVFGWPGVGSLALQSILNLDVPVIMGVVLLSGISVACVNLIVDILYGVIDPRVSYA